MKYRPAKPLSSVEQQRRSWLEGVKLQAEATMAAGLTPDHQPDALKTAVKTVHQMTTDNMAIIERNAEMRRKNGASLPQIACREGCDFCCYLRVRAAVPEVLTIVDYVRSNFTEIQIRDLQSRIDANLAEFEGLDATERANKMVPCPLLLDHRCMVHQVRPIQCRSHHSVDMEACKKGFAFPDTVQIPHFLDVDTVVGPIAAGVQMAIKTKRLKDRGVLLSAALDAALNDVASQERWLEGEDVFAGAVDEELKRLAGGQPSKGGL